MLRRRTITSITFTDAEMIVTTPSSVVTYHLDQIVAGSIGTIVSDTPTTTPLEAVGIPARPLADEDGRENLNGATFTVTDGQSFFADIRDVASPTYASAAAMAAAISAAAGM